MTGSQGFSLSQPTPAARRAKLRDVILTTVFLCITALYILLMVRDRVPAAGWIVLAGLWVVYTLLERRLTFSTPMDLSILGLAALIPLSLAVSTDQALSMPKVAGLLLGMALFYLIVNAIRSLRHLPIVIAALIVLAFGVPLVGLIGADWSGSGFSLPSRILAHLPVQLSALHAATGSGGIHVNTVGGALAFLVPLLIGLLWDRGALPPGRKTLGLAIKLVIAAALLLVVVILVLTQSRAAILGSAAGILALAFLKNKRFLWLIPILLILLVVALLVFADGNIANFIALLDTTQENDTLPVRMEYWGRTVYLIQDFPYTGAGLGTYGRLFHDLYTFTPFSIQGEATFYAHNMYLAVAANMGIPALVLYFALIAGFFGMTARTLRHPQPVVRVLSIGLACGLLANLVFGLFDNFMLGEKLAVILWIYYGLGTALYIHAPGFGQTEQASSTGKQPGLGAALTTLGIGAAGWILFSLAAIAFINLNPYIALGVAAVGGIALGILQTSRFAETRKQPILVHASA